MARHEQFNVTDLTVSTINGAAMDALMGNGEAYYLVPDTSSTSLYREMLLSRGLDPTKMYTTLAAAEDAMKANRGDTLYVYPGEHAVTSSITWDKNNTNIVGLGSKNQRHQPSTLTTGAVRFKCVTSAIGSILNVTAHYVSMADVGTMNTYAGTSNLTDVIVAGRNFHGVRCAFRGGNAAEQVGNALAGIPVTIITDAYGFRFDECEFGSAGNTTRTTGPGYIRFAAGAGGAGIFNQCAFSMRSETTGANVSGFTVEQSALDRLTTFRGCTFYNFSENWGALPDYLFNIDQTTTFDILLMGCGMAGFDIVSDSARVKTIDPAPNSAGVESAAVATT
jgi:hypothetical protein